MTKLEAIMRKQLEGCKLTACDGTVLYTPDSHGCYPALWTRDFYYMIACAGELIPAADIRACLTYTYSHARTGDCWMPDRVGTDGRARYTAGDWDDRGYPLPNLDNAAFALLCLVRYAELAGEEEGRALLDRWGMVLQKALDAVPLSPEGLVYNDTGRPHSPYGFTDCICKTGRLSFESLLMWQAFTAGAKCGIAGCAEKAGRIETAFEAVFFTPDSPLPLAATEICRRADMWCACFALSIGFPLSEKRRLGIQKELVRLYDGIVQRGQLRHTLPGEFWDKTFVPVNPGEYQNGAYWATPIKWLVDALIDYDRDLAVKTVKDALKDFEEGGICECINGEYRKLPDYVASAAAVYAAVKTLAEKGIEI